MSSQCRSSRLFWVAVLVMLAVPAPAVVAQPAPDYPLPAGARLRFGSPSIQVADGVATAALSPDGKVIAVAGPMGIAFLDRVSGARLGQFDVEKQDFINAQLFAFAPAGMLVCGGRDGLRLIKVPSGKLLRTIAVGNPDLVPFGRVSFSRDGAQFAVIMPETTGEERLNKAYVVETHNGQVRKVCDLGPGYQTGASLSPDGKRLATWSNQLPLGAAAAARPAQRIDLWDVATGKPNQPIEVQGAAALDGVAFAPDGQTLAVNADESDYYLIDLATGKERSRFVGRCSRVKELAYSPDGGLLVSAGEDGTLQAWKTSDLQRLELGPRVKTRLLSLALPGAGQILALGLDGDIPHWWDGRIGRAPGGRIGHHSQVRAVAFAPDGKTVVSISRDGTALQWDAATGRVTHQTRLVVEEQPKLVRPLGFNSTVLAADARYAATSNALSDSRQLRFWDVRRGEPLCELRLPTSGRMLGLALSRDGRWLAAGANDAVVRIWDTTTGQSAGTLKLDVPGRVVPATPELAFTPDAQHLAVSATYFIGNGAMTTAVQVLETRTGKSAFTEALTFKRGTGRGPANCTPACSADGRLVAFAVGFDVVQLVQTKTGRHERQLQLPEEALGITAIQFSPDGRTLAVASGGQVSVTQRGTPGARIPARLHLCELASGHLRAQFTGPQGPTNNLAFAPDGRTLASAGADTTVILWDLGGIPSETTLSAAELAKAWTDLASADAKSAFATQRRLVGSPGAALPFLKRTLRPAAPPKLDLQQLGRWLAELDDGEFATRDRARIRLEALGSAAEASLRQARAGKITLETRRRIDDLLDKLERRQPTPAELQAVRAVEVLERIATPEARALVAELARGEALARLTREAVATLARLQP